MGCAALGPLRIDRYYVAFSLTGKVPHCECDDQGSSPGGNQKQIMLCSWNVYEREQGALAEMVYAPD